MEQCQECGGEIAHAELASTFSDLFSRIESGVEGVSDVEEAIYFNVYCTKCAQRFLVDADDKPIYDDQ